MECSMYYTPPIESNQDGQLFLSFQHNLPLNKLILSFLIKLLKHFHFIPKHSPYFLTTIYRGHMHLLLFIIYSSISYLPTITFHNYCYTFFSTDSLIHWYIFFLLFLTLISLKMNISSFLSLQTRYVSSLLSATFKLLIFLIEQTIFKILSYFIYLWFCSIAYSFWNFHCTCHWHKKYRRGYLSLESTCFQLNFMDDIILS